MKDEALTEKVQEIGLHLYQGTFDEDYLIAQWWDSLVESDDISLLVSSSAYSLSNFYGLFKSPNMLAYTVRDDQMESAHWAEPVSTSENAVFFSSWCLAAMRGKKQHAVVMTTVYELIFGTGKKVIIAITKQEQLLDLFRKMGYVILDPVPYLFDHDQAWVVYLTKENFERSRLYAVANKISNKEYN